MTKKELLEKRILEALTAKKVQLAEYDAYLKAEHDKYMEEAANQTEECFKKDAIHMAKASLNKQLHGYEFIEEWKNAIAKAMYNRIYHQWHSAECGGRGFKGHGAYITSELNEDEKANVDEVFNRLVKRGYLKLSKSGKMATFTK